MLHDEIHQDTGDEEFTGPVRSVRVERARAAERHESPDEATRLPLRAMTFDRKGRKEEENQFGPDGSVEARTVFMYDAEDRLSEKRHYRDEQFAGKTLYAYDDAGRLAQEMRQSPGGTLLNRTVYRYDADGFRVEAADYGQDGALTTRILSRYDDGRLTEVVFCGGRGSGLLTRREDGAVTLSPVGMPGGRKSVCGDGVFITRFVFTYDEQGHESGLLQYAGDEALLSRKAFTRDAEGRQFTISHYGRDGELRRKEEHRRELDARGNWTKDTKLTWDFNAGVAEPAEVLHRSIDYY